ncbi:MAG: NAD(P)-dependent alcohol dehydrogenase [Bacteroidetes bacterium]|nr:NAD(P)-dependent alcohol dehydrogenase [Bacteroidota bacterium]
MKAAIITKFGKPDVIEITDLPQPKLKKGEVLIQVKAAALNPKDILIRKGKFKIATGSKFPMQIGHDLAGMVVDSNGSTMFKNGAEVFGMINGWSPRTCAEFLHVSEKELYWKPQNLSFEDAAGIPLAGQTALQAIRDMGNLKPNQKICINGASGGVGTLAIQISKILGGYITTVSSGRNLEFCHSLGADKMIDYSKEKITESDQKFDVFFDVFGNYSFPKTKHLLTKKGIYISTVPGGKIIIEQLKNPFRRQKAKLVVVKSKSQNLKWLYEKIETNLIKPVTDKVFPLGEIRAAQAYIETKRAKGKVIIKIE